MEEKQGSFAEVFPASEHKCHAIGCQRHVKPALLMCGYHWRLVPHNLQMAVWANYRAGQEIDKQPTPAYLEAAKNAIQAVKAKTDKAAK